MHDFKSVDCRSIDLKYFVQWRPYLWAHPTAKALQHLAPFRGKRVLEVGGGNGRMSCLLALMGASVTMVERTEHSDLKAEVQKWRVADRVEFVLTDGTLDALQGQRFDAIFGKSVLYCIEDLGHFLDEIDGLLANGGRFAFVDNYKGGPLLMLLRRVLIYQNRRNTHLRYFGVQPRQLQLFEERFDNVRIKRFRCFVYEIFGEKQFRGTGRLVRPVGHWSKAGIGGHTAHYCKKGNPPLLARSE